MKLYSSALEQMGYSPLPVYEEPPESPIPRPDLTDRHPLVQSTGARVGQYFISEGRQIKRLRRAHKEPLAELHPETDARYGIVDGVSAALHYKRLDRAHIYALH